MNPPKPSLVDSFGKFIKTPVKNRINDLHFRLAFPTGSCQKVINVCGDFPMTVNMKNI